MEKTYNCTKCDKKFKSYTGYWVHNKKSIKK